MSKLFYFLFFSIIVMMACRDNNNEKVANKVIAKVYNKTLLYSDLEGMLPDNATPEDSARIISAFAERWVRENLMMYEAERNVPKDLNIDELVKSYRSSLILSNYEKILTEEKLDSTISQQELQDFYEKNKEQYQLETPIVRCYFVKVGRPTPEVEKLHKLWNSTKEEDHQSLINYANQYAATYLLADTVWYKIDDIITELPEGTLSSDNVSKGRELTLKDDNFQYFLKILAVKSKKEIAPLEFIKDQATKFILHKRKIKLLDDKKEDLYETESRRNNVKIYLE